MPLPFEFEGKRVVVLQQAAEAEFVVPCVNQVVHFQDLGNKKRKYIEEPKSVLDNVNCSPSPPTSTSTLSSSLGGGAVGAGLAVVSGNPSLKWPLPENQDSSCPNVGISDIAGAGRSDEKCGEMEDWENVLSESGQEQSILRWIMGDVEDPSMGLNKLLHGGGTADDGELTGSFGFLDQAYLGFAPPAAAAPDISGHHHHIQDPQNPFFSQLNTSQIYPFDVKPQFLTNHQNPTFFPPLEHQTLMPPQPKRHNSGNTQYNFSMPKTPFLDSPPNPKMSTIDHQGIIDQLFKAADMIQSGNNPILAQSILARLNHQLSPIGKPFERAAFYFKEALQSLMHSIINNLNPISPPFSLILKISAYKSFSEVSPYVQFTNFTRNQALLEALDGFDHVHVIDFDIGYGDQWASFMQELVLRSNNNRALSLKITSFASLANDHLELSLTRENLVNFASEIDLRFDFEIVNIDVLASVSWSLPFHVSDHEAIAVNLPISAVSNHQIPLRFIKNLSPKIVVSVDRGCERTDLPFPNHLIHALESFTSLIESLDAVNMNVDGLQKIERFLIQPSIEKIITGRFSFAGKTQNWQEQFLSSGLTPLTFSNFTESQALCVIKRNPVRGFHIEKRQTSLILCWQRRKLVSVSVWR